MKEIKLHLGCGKRYLQGYVHIDLGYFSHIDYQTDIGDLPMFMDNSVSVIYSSHSLEYYDRLEVQNVLREWFRILKPHGILRVAVPDFKKLVDVYLSSLNLNLIHGPLYGRWEIPNTNSVIYHKTVYDYISLKSVLENIGFTNIRHWDWHEIFKNEYEGFDDYSQAYIPHMDKTNGTLISLNVEADKP